MHGHQVPSDKNIPFNEKPEMKSREITDLGKAALRSGKYDGGQVRLNFPNPGARSAQAPAFCSRRRTVHSSAPRVCADMVGHTGDLEATIVACTAVDKCVKVLLPSSYSELLLLPGSRVVLAWVSSWEPSLSASLWGRSSWMRWKQWVGGGWSPPIMATLRTWCACIDMFIFFWQA